MAVFFLGSRTNSEFSLRIMLRQKRLYKIKENPRRDSVEGKRNLWNIWQLYSAVWQIGKQKKSKFIALIPLEHLFHSWGSWEAEPKASKRPNQIPCSLMEQGTQSLDRGSILAISTELFSSLHFSACETVWGKKLKNLKGKTVSPSFRDEETEPSRFYQHPRKAAFEVQRWTWGRLNLT